MQISEFLVASYEEMARFAQSILQERNLYDAYMIDAAEVLLEAVARRAPDTAHEIVCA